MLNVFVVLFQLPSVAEVVVQTEGCSIYFLIIEFVDPVF